MTRRGCLPRRAAVEWVQRPKRTHLPESFADPLYGITLFTDSSKTTPHNRGSSSKNEQIEEVIRKTIERIFVNNTANYQT